ncbi:uncharacterized protein LOC113509043 isoform X2 [Trichoplusia ni]|uniref:Uncharacterized protein LOC113509043 isoform X2 n=1 Tax=Trichoplusia ni TaxID=7111 RepID=A0A7E5X5P9_TRINI|nr:uncharacterized protein LOC113509043 isoform X2 [Trichoplusia ni]
MAQGIPSAFPSQTHYSNKYKSHSNSLHAPHRLLEIMAIYTEEARQRTKEMNEMRFMYEESPQYEQGYVMSEIIERFRKVVEHTKRPIEFHSDNFFNTLKRTELIQVLYFEIYHLVRMMHEIPVKYDAEEEFTKKEKKKPTKQELYDTKKSIEEMQKRREREKRKRRKLNAKLREAFDRGMALSKYGKKRDPYNKWWPVDYGWEIDHWW